MMSFQIHWIIGDGARLAKGNEAACFGPPFQVRGCYHRTVCLLRVFYSENFIFVETINLSIIMYYVPARVPNAAAMLSRAVAPSNA